MIIRLIVFLHLIGAVMMGFYLVFPFLLGKMKALSLDGQAGYLRIAYHINFISQFTLIAQLITGCYLISVIHMSVAWLITVFTLFTAVGALMGFFSRLLRQSTKQLIMGNDVGYIKPVGAFSYAIFVLLIAILSVMFFR